MINDHTEERGQMAECPKARFETVATATKMGPPIPASPAARLTGQFADGQLSVRVTNDREPQTLTLRKEKSR
jgi:hypothetical protein